MPAPKNDPNAAAPAEGGGRKPCKEKSPVEVVLEQADNLRSEIAEAEEDPKAKGGQLENVEQARKLFEGAWLMQLLRDNLKSRLPPLLSQEAVDDPVVYAKSFLPGTAWAWYVLEGEEE